MVQYEISIDSVNIPTDSGGVTLTVEEDPDGDGEPENSDTITLSDGVTSYTTQDTFSGSGYIRLVWNIGPPSDRAYTAGVLHPVDITPINPTGITIDGDIVTEITIDGNVVSSLTVDGETVF